MDHPVAVSGCEMQCIAPFRVTKNLDKNLYPEGLEVPCGKCLACRVKKRQEWCVRLLHESNSWSNSIFITLTYDQLSLPYNKNKNHYIRAITGQGIYPTLKKKELQDFFKRLRKSIEPRQIKYFAVGEYGENERPHYHAIIYGMSLQDTDKEIIKNAWLKCDWNQPEISKESFGLAEHDSMLYVAKYVNKDFTSNEALEKYKIENREVPFRLLSMGLGKEFIEKNQKQVLNNGFVSIRGIKQSIPRYYIKKLKSLSPVDAEKLLLASREASLISESALVGRFTGLETTEDAYYKTQNAKEVVEYYEAKSRYKKQYALNIQARIDLKEAKKIKKV